jgi:hypothetical protein
VWHRGLLLGWQQSQWQAGMLHRRVSPWAAWDRLIPPPPVKGSSKEQMTNPHLKRWFPRALFIFLIRPYFR